MQTYFNYFNYLIILEDTVQYNKHLSLNFIILLQKQNCLPINFKVMPLFNSIK